MNPDITPSGHGKDAHDIYNYVCNQLATYVDAMIHGTADKICIYDPMVTIENARLNNICRRRLTKNTSTVECEKCPEYLKMREHATESCNKDPLFRLGMRIMSEISNNPVSARLDADAKMRDDATKALVNELGYVKCLNIHEKYPIYMYKYACLPDTMVISLAELNGFIASCDPQNGIVYIRKQI